MLRLTETEALTLTVISVTIALEEGTPAEHLLRSHLQVHTCELSKQQKQKRFKWTCL